MIPPFVTSIVPKIACFNKLSALYFQRFQSLLRLLKWLLFRNYLSPNFHMKKSVRVSELTFSVPLKIKGSLCAGNRA